VGGVWLLGREGDGDRYSIVRFVGVIVGVVLIGGVGFRGVAEEKEEAELLHFEEDARAGFRGDEFGGGSGAKEAYVVL
jgi:hypothetical protein